jgi:BMFP domain-containing protein YqiC
VSKEKNLLERRKGKVKRLILILTVVLALAFSAPVMSAPFPDVPSNHWAYDAVNELASRGLIVGYPDGTFRGNNPLTRYELAMILSRLIPQLEKIAGGPAIDVSEFVTKAELAEALADYVKVDQLDDYVKADQLADYVTFDALANYVTKDDLADYVTKDDLADYVTVDQLADYVTVDQLADYVTVDQLADYVTVDQLADYVTVDQLADYVTVDQLADYVTVDQLADYVTVDQLADYVTVDQLADYVTVDQLADYVTVDQLADYVTVDQLADYVTVDQLADYVTVDQLADYVTVDQLADYVTVDQLADYVTVDQLADYVTVDQLADYVTVDQLADYVTVDQLADYVTVDQLADYVTFDVLADYVTVDQLADYVTTDQLADYVTVDQLADYVTVDQLADYVTVDQLADYVTVDQLADYVTVDQLADYVKFDDLADYVKFDDLADYVTVDVLADYVSFDDLSNYVTTDDFDALKSLVADLSDQLEAIGANVGDLKDRVSALEDAMAKINLATPEKVAELSAKVAELEKKVTAPEKVAELESKVSALEKKAVTSVTTNVTVTTKYKLGEANKEPSPATSTSNFLANSALTGVSNLDSPISGLLTQVSPGASVNPNKTAILPDPGMTAAGHLTLKINVPGKSGSDKIYGEITLSSGIDSDISAFYTGLPSGSLSVSSFKAYAEDGKVTAEGGNLTAFEYTPFTLAKSKLFTDVDGNAVTNRGLAITYKLSNNISVHMAHIFLKPSVTYGNGATTNTSGIAPVWANRVSMKFGEPLTLNINVVKEKTNEIVAGADTTMKLGNITVGAEYALSMDKTFTPLGSDADAMKLTVSIPVGSTIKVKAGYMDVGTNYSATWGSYTANRTGYNVGATITLGGFTIQGGYAYEQEKTTPNKKKTGYGVGLKTDGFAIQYTSTTDNIDPNNTGDLLEASVAPFSWLKLATKYDVVASTWNGLAAEIAIPNLPKMVAYYNPNATVFKYGVLIPEYTFANFLTLKAQFDQGSQTQYFVDGSVKLTDALSLYGKYVNYPNNTTSWTAGATYTYKWSDNAKLTIDLKHVIDNAGKDANVLATTVAVTF